MMDLEMQLLPTPSNHGGGSGAKELIQTAILVVQSVHMFLEGISQRSLSVSSVSSSESIDYSPDQEDEKARCEIMEEVTAGQTAPLLIKPTDNNLQSRNRLRTLAHVLHSIAAFKAHVRRVSSGANEGVDSIFAQVTEASDSLIAPSEHHVSIDHQSANHSQVENISKIVRQKNLLTLQQFGGLGGVKDALATDLDKGISDEEALRRLQELYQSLSPKHTFLHFICEEVKNITFILLSLAAALSIIVGINEEGLHDGWNDGVVVLTAIVLHVLIASILKYWKERKARRKLKKQQSEEGSVSGFQVIRGGDAKDIGESKLVYGDLLLLKTGCQVPADGLFVDGDDLELDYGSESFTANEQNPFLSYGEKVVNGDARMVVTSTYVMIRKATRFNLETQVDKLNTHIHHNRIIISILIILVLFLRYVAGELDGRNVYRPDSVAEPTGIRTFSHTFRKVLKQSKYTTKVLTKLLSVLLVGLTEGVPFVVSLAIVYWNNETLPAKATEQDSHSILRMAAVSKICTDTFGEFTEEVHQLLKAEVKACRECGIGIIIVSSKKLPVLKDISLQYGLITDNDPQLFMLTGEDFRKYTDKERLENINKIHVLGEAFASDKLLLVETLRKNGSVVAFLGQRTEEAPALIEANIGIAMGRQSSEKALESSDIIICDQSHFPEITRMVDSGKCIHRNIQSFLQPVLITIISSTLISFIQTAAWGDASFTIVESIWANLAVLFLGGLALLTKASADKPVSLVPVTVGRSLITAQMARNILLQVSYQVACLVIVQTNGSGVLGSSQDMNTMVFNIFVVCQFFNLFNARELQKMNFFRCIHRHKAFWAAASVFMVLHAAFITVQDILGYGARLKWRFWVGCVVVGLLSWFVDWIGKCITWFFIFLYRFCNT